MNAELYTLRWRGKESGPHSLAELERMIEATEICIWHDVRQDGQWTTVGEVLRVWVPAPSSATAARSLGLSGSTAAPVSGSSSIPRRTKLPVLHPRRGGPGP